MEHSSKSKGILFSQSMYEVQPYRFVEVTIQPNFGSVNNPFADVMLKIKEK